MRWTYLELVRQRGEASVVCGRWGRKTREIDFSSPPHVQIFCFPQDQERKRFGTVSKIH
jgi:hypothetical protein